MKKKTLMATLGVAALMLVAVPAYADGSDAPTPYTVTDETPPQECVPSQGTPGYWEDVPDITHPAVGTPTIKVDNPDYKPATEGTPAVWANFSPNEQTGTFVGPPDYPTDPRGTWHDRGKLPPGQAGPDGVYENGNPDKGGNWFYRQAAVPGTPAEGEPTIEIKNPDYKPERVEVTPNIWHDPIPPVVCPPTPAFQAYQKTARWLLPASWDYATEPTYQEAIFPQDALTGDLPCGRWSQDDTYWIDSEADAALFASLDDDGVLTNGEDAAIYQSHTFTKGPECVVTPPTPTPAPDPSITPAPEATETRLAATGGALDLTIPVAAAVITLAGVGLVLARRRVVR